MQRLRIALAMLVAGVWFAGYVISYVRGGDAPHELTGLMAIVLGWAFAGTVRDVIQRKLDEVKRKGGEDEE